MRSKPSLHRLIANFEWNKRSPYAVVVDRRNTTKCCLIEESCDFIAWFIIQQVKTSTTCSRSYSSHGLFSSVNSHLFWRICSVLSLMYGPMTIYLASFVLFINSFFSLGLFLAKFIWFQLFLNRLQRTHIIFAVAIKTIHWNQPNERKSKINLKKKRKRLKKRSRVTTTANNANYFVSVWVGCCYCCFCHFFLCVFVSTICDLVNVRSLLFSFSFRAIFAFIIVRGWRRVARNNSILV